MVVKSVCNHCDGSGVLGRDGLGVVYCEECPAGVEHILRDMERRAQVLAENVAWYDAMAKRHDLSPDEVERRDEQQEQLEILLEEHTRYEERLRGVKARILLALHAPA